MGYGSTRGYIVFEATCLSIFLLIVKLIGLYRDGQKVVP